MYIVNIFLLRRCLNEIMCSELCFVYINCGFDWQKNLKFTIRIATTFNYWLAQLIISIKIFRLNATPRWFIFKLKIFSWILCQLNYIAYTSLVKKAMIATLVTSRRDSSSSSSCTSCTALEFWNFHSQQNWSIWWRWYLSYQACPFVYHLKTV